MKRSGNQAQADELQKDPAQVAPRSAGQCGGWQRLSPIVDAAEESGWTTIGNHIINDPNIMYSLHVYDHVADPPQVQDVKWGPILHHYPIYYGEWAFLPNANIPAHCKSIPHDQAPQIVENFLNYMASRGANWTAWQFDPGHLIQNYTTFAPTTLNVPWTCGDTTSGAGMGEIIKQYLTGQA